MERLERIGQGGERCCREVTRGKSAGKRNRKTRKGKGKVSGERKKDWNKKSESIKSYHEGLQNKMREITCGVPGNGRKYVLY